MDHMECTRLGCGQDGFRKSQFTASKIEGFPFLVSQCPLDDWCNAIAYLLSFSKAFYDTGIPQNAKVVRHVRLWATQLPHEIRDAFLIRQQRLQNPKSGFICQSFEHRRTFPWA